MEAQTAFQPSTADHLICSVVNSAETAPTLTQIADALFPAYCSGWVRERCHRLRLAGILEYDTTQRPTRVRLTGRRT